jgi:hypothetical protein
MNVIGIQTYEVKRMDWKTLLDLGGWAAGIGAFLTLIKAIRFWKSDHERDDVDVSDRYQVVASKSAEYASGLLDRVASLEADIAKLRQDVEAQDEYIFEMKQGTRQLLKQIVEAGMDPVWTPPEWTKPSRKRSDNG